MLSIMSKSNATIPSVRIVKLLRVAVGVAAGAWLDRVLHRSGFDAMLARRVRRAFEVLGPTFVKAGQLLSCSSSPLPKVWADEMALCRDHVTSVPWPAVERLLQEELGDRYILLTDIDPVPLAAGSMAQVHVAHLADGTEVVVKVQRPGLGRVVADDMRLLKLAARLAMRFSATCVAANATALVDDFARGLEEQLSFKQEAANVVTMQQALGATPVRVPAIYRDLSSERVLVMERLHGVAADDVAAIDSLGIDRDAVVREVVSALLLPALTRGVFHADMHPGNMLILADGRLGLLDFGVIGRMDGAAREAASELLAALADRRLADVVIAMLKVVDVASTDLVALLPDVQSLVVGCLDKPIADVDVREVITTVLSLASRHGFALPESLVALLKQMVYISGMCQQLDPTFDVLGDLGPIVRLARASDAVAA
jgi:ubiquinone biosynthesis protein